jgi:hypothetical protein
MLLLLKNWGTEMCIGFSQTVKTSVVKKIQCQLPICVRVFKTKKESQKYNVNESY